ncbi:MAG TPA: hypothetical protein EYH38_01660, partial [Leucothrix sp.]|nr:hypothetical protein [Leucothrix sp.]
MRIKLLPLLIAVAVNLLGAQKANAEQLGINENNLQAPVWANEQVPIAWADCIPVPVMPSPPPMMNNSPMGAMTNIPFSSGFPIAAPNQPMMLLPPPSPFFNPAVIAPVPQVSCDNEDSIKLNKLQSHYNQAATASKAKIAELQQALDDIQHQMADSRGIINQLESKLGLQEMVATDQSKFKVLQGAYQLQNHKVIELKKKLVELDTEKKALQLKLDGLREDRGNLHKQLATLQKVDSEFKVLQGAYKL